MVTCKGDGRSTALTAGVDLHLGGLVTEHARRLLGPSQIFHLDIARASAC